MIDSSSSGVGAIEFLMELYSDILDFLAVEAVGIIGLYLSFFPDSWGNNCLIIFTLPIFLIGEGIFDD